MGDQYEQQFYQQHPEYQPQQESQNQAPQQQYQQPQQQYQQTQQPYQQQPQYQQQQYQQQQQAYMPPKPDSHLAKAIIVTLLCCQVLGLVSIIKAANVDSLYASGQYAAAQEASDSANKWANWGIGLGIAFVVLYGLFWLVYVAIVGAAAAFGNF